MKMNCFQWRSLQGRVTLFTVGVFVIGIWSLAFYASLMLREDMQGVLGQQQLSTVSFIASEVDQELQSRLSALEKVAERISPAILGSPPALRAFLEDRQFFLGLFSGSVIVFGSDGAAIVELPLPADESCVSFVAAETIAAALQEGKSSIGRPLMGSKLQAPVFAMTVPIRDMNGKAIGVLAGVTKLGVPNFLDHIAGNQDGKSGTYELVAPQHRLVVTASNKRGAMELLPAAGSNPMIDRFAAGYEGSVVMLDPLGTEVLASVRAVPVAGWYVVAAVPTAEAFAPIRAMQQRMLLATIMLTLLAGGMTWWLLRIALSPALLAAKKLAAVSTTNGRPQPLPISREDEIGELIDGFNRILNTLAQTESALREQEEFFRLIAENLDGFVVVLDIEGRRVYNSPSYARLLGDRNPAGTSSFADVHPDDRERVVQAFRDTVATGVGQHLEYRFLTPDGGIRLMESRGGVIMDSEGRVIRVVVVSHDVTERKEAEEKIHHLAFYDALTQLPNRLTLSDRLGQTMAASKRSGCYSALMFIDLDNFKPLNDMHGHEVGDLLLIEAASRLKACVREMDTVARFGGDEFVVMISELALDEKESLAQAGTIAEKIRAALAEPYQLLVKAEGAKEAHVEHQCSASIGVAVFINHQASQDDILKWADKAMYQAKEAGRNVIRFYDAMA